RDQRGGAGGCGGAVSVCAALRSEGGEFSGGGGRAGAHVGGGGLSSSRARKAGTGAARRPGHPPGGRRTPSATAAILSRGRLFVTVICNASSGRGIPLRPDPVSDGRRAGRLCLRPLSRGAAATTARPAPGSRARASAGRGRDGTSPSSPRRRAV